MNGMLSEGGGMVRWWRLALLVLAGVVAAAAATVLAVAVNVATGGTAPKGFPPVEAAPAVVDRRGDGGRRGRVVAGVGGAAVV